MVRNWSSLSLLLLACASPSAPPSPSAQGAATPARAPAAEKAPAPKTASESGTPREPVDPAPGDAPAPIAGVRDLHPRSGLPDCLEMYSACSPDGQGGQRCTSASFTLGCGESGQVPGGDRVRCVCP